MPARALLITPLVLLVLATGCGGNGVDDRQKVADKVQQFATALGSGDYKALCDHVLAPALVERVNGLGLPCDQQLARSVSAVQKPFAIVERVTVQGDKATAFVQTGAKGQPHSIDTIGLIKTDAGWRISSRTSGAGAASPATPRP